MPRLKLLILDACVVIKLHEYGIWNRIIEVCDIHLSRIVAEDESQFHQADDDARGQDIELSSAISTGKIHVFDVPAADVHAFKSLFDANYFGEIDAGEAESLAFLHVSRDQHQIASADAIVYKVLGNLGLGDQGISLEEVLQKCGLGRDVEWGYSKTFREKNTHQGFQDKLQGRGLKR